MKRVTNAAGAKRYIFSARELEAAAAEQEGFCVHCGERAQNVEPDAESYLCLSCNRQGVCGADQLAVIGRAY